MRILRKRGSDGTLSTVKQLAKAVVVRDSNDNYSMSLEFALTELVRDEMRRIALEDSLPANDKTLLHDSIRRVLGSVENSLYASESRADLSKYANQIKSKLKYPAKEIQELAVVLERSRRTAKLGAKEQMVSDRGQKFIVHELGLRDAIQAMLVEPTQEVEELDIDSVRRGGMRVEGEWFPYEVFVDDFVAVVDDDGSIFVSTENLPAEIQARALASVSSIARLLYG